MEVLSDVISEIQTKSKGAWLTVGGDFNDRDISEIKLVCPELELIKTAPTRGDATLDLVYCNYSDHTSQITEDNQFKQTGQIGQTQITCTV